MLYDIKKTNQKALRRNQKSLKRAVLAIIEQCKSIEEVKECEGVRKWR